MVGMNTVLAAINLWFIVQLVRDRHDEAAFEVLEVRPDRRVPAPHPARARRRHPEVQPGLHPRPRRDDQDAFLVRGATRPSAWSCCARTATPRTSCSTTSRPATATSPRRVRLAPQRDARRPRHPSRGDTARHGRRLLRPARLPPRRRLLGARRRHDHLFIRRVVPLVALAALVGFVRSSTCLLLGPTCGSTFASGRSSSAAGPCASPGAPGVLRLRDWVPTQWLPQVGMAWLEDQLGIDGVVCAGGVCIWSCALLYAASPAAARCRPPRPHVVAMIAASPGFSARPQLFSYLFVSPRRRLAARPRGRAGALLACRPCVDLADVPRHVAGRYLDLCRGVRRGRAPTPIHCRRLPSWA